jgi:hypothetical protein
MIQFILNNKLTDIYTYLFIYFQSCYFYLFCILFFLNYLIFKRERNDLNKPAGKMRLTVRKAERVVN